MKKLYYYSNFLDGLHINDKCDFGFRSTDILHEDEHYYYIHDNSYRICKKTLKEEYKSVFSSVQGYIPSKNGNTYYQSKQEWESAKKEYLNNLLTKNEAERLKILKDMEI